MSYHQITILPDYETDWGNGWRDSIAWCNQHVGQQSITWWYQGLGQFEFAREQDRTMFVLRWGRDQI
jgi:hypothetical protein